MLKLETRLEKNAKNTDEAIREALDELGVTEDEVNIEIVDEGKKGVLGIGSKEAKIIVEVKEPICYKAKMFLGEIFKSMNLEINITATLDDENLKIELSGNRMGIIIGKRGDTLDSLQYLTSLVVNKGEDKYYRVTIDTENYRDKRHQSLIDLADRLANKVARTAKKHTLEPMNPYERRIIHSALQSYDSVTTYSIGEDPYRKVVIAPKNSTKYSPKASYSSANYPRPKKQTSYENFEEYLKDNEENNE